MVDISAAIASAKQAIASSNSSSITGSSSTEDSFDTFLSLLTTQLQNQDPTKPLDTNEMTQQLVQFSEVEQLLRSNQKLEALLQLSAANASLSVISYVGKEITSAGDTTSLANNSASWGLDVPANATDVTYVVKDTAGNEIYSTIGSLETGATSFNWDGTTSSGGTADPGKYSLTVTARDSTGENINVGISVKGVVDGIDMSDDVPVLLVNGSRFKMDDVSQIRTIS